MIKKQLIGLFILTISMVTITVFALIVSPAAKAHPGNTASDGCHYCRTNCDYWGVPWGERHCHNAPAPPVEEPDYEPDPPAYEPPDEELDSSSQNTTQTDTTNSTPSNSKDGCFIATAAYGSPEAPDVDKLRTIRNNYLLKNEVGRFSVNLYYQFSPEIARFIENKPLLKWPIRELILKPIISASSPLVDGKTEAKKVHMSANVN